MNPLFFDTLIGRCLLCRYYCHRPLLIPKPIHPTGVRFRRSVHPLVGCPRIDSRGRDQRLPPFLGAPGEGYELRNFTYAQLAIGTILARIFVSWIFIKPYYAYRVVSIYEFLEIRFGATTRQAASAIFLITRALASGTRLYVAAIILVLAFEMITGSRPTQSQELLITFGSLLILVALTSVYTSLGGIKGSRLDRPHSIPCHVHWAGICSLAPRPVHSRGLEWISDQNLTNPVISPFGALGLRTKATLCSKSKEFLKVNIPSGPHFLRQRSLPWPPTGQIKIWCSECSPPRIPARSRLALVLSGLADIPIVMAFLTIGILLLGFTTNIFQIPTCLSAMRIFSLSIFCKNFRQEFGGLLIAGIFGHNHGVIKHRPQRAGYFLGFATGTNLFWPLAFKHLTP